MGRILAVANHKGGVAKTTSAVHLSAAAAHRGRRVLLVDLDAQGHASSWWLDGQSPADLQHVIVGGLPVAQVVNHTRVPGLDVLPASLALARLEQDLVGMLRREDRVARALAPLRGQYDLLVLDTAPALSLLNTAALAAADAVLVPVTPTLLAADGLGGFLGWLDDLRAEQVICAPTLGVLLCAADLDGQGRPRTRIGRETAAALEAADGLPLLPVLVPRRIAVEDLAERRLVVGDPPTRALAPDVADAYQRLADEVLARLGRLEVTAR
jgi:chromosome partitioning protein